jgi:hypothetical protein
MASEASRPTREPLTFERYVCTKCGTLCAGVCSIGYRVVCADCFKDAYLTWLANTGQVTSSGL